MTNHQMQTRLDQLTTELRDQFLALPAEDQTRAQTAMLRLGEELADVQVVGVVVCRALALASMQCSVWQATKAEGSG